LAAERDREGERLIFDLNEFSKGVKISMAGFQGLNLQTQ